MERSILSTVKVGPDPRISVDYYGKGETVFLLHGIGGNKRNWDDNIVEIAKTHKVIAWDARGYGASDDYEGPFKFSDAADDLLKVLDYFECKKTHLIGLSMGARIACWFYNKYPNRVRSMVLCDTNFGSKDFSEEEKFEFINSRAKPLKNGKKFEEFSHLVARSLIGNQLDQAVLKKVIKSLNLLRKDSYLKTIESFVYYDDLDIFQEINVPSLVLVGDLDRLTPKEIAKKIANKITDSNLKIIRGAGHLINIENPKIFNHYILKFLKDLTKKKKYP